MSITEGMKVIEIANFYELARRTLGRKQNDKRAIPQDYLAALRRFTEAHPDWTNFVVDLDMQGGVVTCGSCDESFPAGRQILPGVFRFKDLTALEEHVQTSAHKHMAGDNEKFASRRVSSAPYKAHRNGSKSISNPQTPSHPRTNARVLSKSLGEIEPPSTSDVEPLSSDIEREGDPASFPRAPSVIELSSSSDDPEPVGKFLKKYTFPDGEVIVIESSDEEDAPTQQVLNSMVSTPRPAQHFGSANTPRPGPSAAGPSSAPRAPGPFPLRNTASQRSWSQYRARDQSAESVRSASVSTGAGSVSSRKRSVQYPDEEFGETEDSADDGAARYWAEAEGRFGKRVRYETDPEDEMADEEEVDDEGMYDGDMYDEDETMAGHGRNRANTLMPGHFPPPTPVPAYQAAADNIFNLPSLEALRQQMDPTNRLFNDALVMPFASGSNIVHPNLGYRAQPMMGPMPVPTTIGSASQRYNHGFNLNYDDKSPTTWIDFDGPNHAKQLQRFFDEAMDEHEGAIPVQDAAKALGLSSTTERLPGMQVVLMPHQLIGVSWMIKQELGKVTGGILADDMGLGKTMQTVALISKNRPDKSNPRKSTLIVAPAALLDQWKQEIIDRTDDNLFKIRVHHGKDKLRSVNDVKKYDIIITTFQTLTNEFPADETDLRKKKSENKKKKSKQGTLDHFIVDSSDEERSSKKKTGNLGPLASTKWFRVVVDEAQNIRNRATRSSRVMSLLDAEYRWALTGTPVTNSLADLYGLVRYLHFSPFNDWAEFNERIARIQKRDPKLAGQRAQALLKKCLLRRTKDSKLDGKPLITLPPKTIDILELEFSPDERQIYAAVEARQQQKMNKFIREGTVMKNYSAILVMILRLRQVCNHPQLIAYAAGEFAPEGAHAVLSEDGEPNSVAASKPAQDAYSTTRAKAIMGDEKFELTMRQFRDTAEEMITAELSGGNIPSDDTIECSVCFEPYVGNARVTSCGHVFCASCLLDLFKQGLQGEVAGNEQFGAGRQFAGQEVRPCPKCRGEITISRILPASIFEPSDKEKDEIKRRVEAKIGTQFKIAHADADEDDDFVPTLKGKGKGKARARIEDDEDEEEADPAAAKTGDELVPGAKMIKMLELLKTWHKEAPEDKIIAYSQWTSMIDLMQILLRRDGFESLRYDGQMKREERDETLSRFKKQGGPKILLISLKCGGVGLNLTEANRVICIDLAWNAATENQAIDRAHRMGQVKPVFVKRLIVKQTIEERILNLQAEKQNLSDAALGEGKGLKMPKMNVAQLKMLFGMA